MVNSEDTLCACGCQQRCSPGRSWRHGHWARVHPARQARPLIERFFEKVHKTETCWLWTGGTDEWGYGRIRLDGGGKKIATHRLSYALHYGPIPDELLCLHRCDIPACVRPDHLFLGTGKDNAQDMVSKGRHGARTHPEKVVRGDQIWSRRFPERVPKGAAHGGAKLTDDDVRAIRQLYKPGMIKHQDLAERFGVSRPLISLILARKLWTHLP